MTTWELGYFVFGFVAGRTVGVVLMALLEANARSNGSDRVVE